MSESESIPAAVLRYLAERWVAVVLLVLTVTFIAQNRDRPSVNLFFFSVSPPQWLVMAILVLVGWAAGAFITPRRRRP